MWKNSGRGNDFFGNLYDWFPADEIRDFPSTKEEFQKYGLSESVFNKYIEFVSRLYGVYFIRNNSLASKYDFLNIQKEKLWEEFIDFCIENNLVVEFVDENGNRMPMDSYNDLDRFKFTYSFQEWSDILNICSLDEFRLELEKMLAEKTDSFYDENSFESFPDDTLYIYKGFIICKRDNHHIEDATAILFDLNGKEIELNVSYCSDCQKFFMDYSIYKHYREKYGSILGNIKMAVNGDYTSNGFDLAEESTLHLCGYTVNQRDNLSAAQRQTIIAAIIENGAMDKHEIISLLNYFIEMNGSKKGNELARTKWRDDLNFALAYNTENQKKFIINKIVPYNKNRFFIVLNKKEKVVCDKPIDKSFLNKPVRHTSNKFGRGVIVDIDQYTITIKFVNGQVVKFTSTVLENGMVEIIE